MFRRRIVFGLVVCLLAVLIVGQTLSQPAQRGQAGGQRGGQREGAQNTERPQMQGRQFDPQQMQKMMEQRMQRQVGATDDEWKTIGPSVMKVSELNRQVSGGGRGGMFSGRRSPTGDQQGRQQTELDKATEQLQTLLENESAKPEDIEKQLTVYRTAREKAKKELAAEQQKLQKQVNVRQKAQLVLMGLLE